MPKAPTTDPDALRQQVAELDVRNAEVRQQLAQLETERLHKQQRAQEEFDRELVTSYSRTALDAEVEQARRDLEDRLADNPLIIALADYLTARLRRHHAIAEHIAALGRQGRDVSSASHAPPPELGSLEEILTRAVQRIADEKIRAELDDLHTRRANAGTTTKENR